MIPFKGKEERARSVAEVDSENLGDKQVEYEQEQWDDQLGFSLQIIMGGVCLERHSRDPYVPREKEWVQRWYHWDGFD